MKVTLTTSLVGKLVTHQSGDVIDTTDSEAQRLIDAGYATPVRKRAMETGTQADPPEKATTKRKRKS